MSGQGRSIRLFCCGETGWRPIGSAAQPVVASRSSKPRCSDSLDVSRPHLSLLPKTSVSYRRRPAVRSIAQCHPRISRLCQSPRKQSLRRSMPTGLRLMPGLDTPEQKQSRTTSLRSRLRWLRISGKPNHDPSPALSLNCIAFWRLKTPVVVWRKSHGRNCAPFSRI